MSPSDLLLLAAPSPVPQADPLAPLYYLIGSMVVLQLGAMIFAGIRWLMSRTVQREDEDKQGLRKRLDKHDERFEEQDAAISELDKVVSNLQNELRQVRDTLESIRGGVAELKIGLDQRFEKQAEFYRVSLKDFVAQLEKKLEDLEYKLRQDMTRAVADHLRTKRKNF